MDIEGVRDGFFDLVEEAAELGRAVPRIAFADDSTCRDVERGEQRRCAMAGVVVRPSLDLTRTHGQHRLAAVERLGLAFLVDTQDESTRRRGQVEPDDVADFGHEVWVCRELEGPGAMRLQPESAPNALDRRGR